MSATSPTRARRGGLRRKVVLEDSDEENAPIVDNDDEEGDDFTPAPAKTRRSTRRTTTNTMADKSPSKSRRVRISEAVETSQLLSPPESVASPFPSDVTELPGAARRSVKNIRASRKSRVSQIPTTLETNMDVDMTDATDSLPTPVPSETFDPDSERTPTKPRALADITEQTLNEQSTTPQKATMNIKTEIQKDEGINDNSKTTGASYDIKPINTQVTVLERPMDIVVRTRQAAIPSTQIPGSDEPRPRTVITYLVLNNFKSYAGRQEVGPFHASFSSVVGPNGSGKSNVIDSLLFVFGFRASKMRQGKLSALIHNSAQHPNLEYCEVEVHFQEVIDLPSGGSNVVPDTKMIISRRAFKNNSSNYYINGKTSTFTIVTTLLKDKGVDLDHKRFLILQGEVESIAQMKPKAMTEHDDGLLEYLEDIIGTSKYKTPIDESAAETETLNEVCTEKNGRVKHVEKERDSLEEKKDKAIAYIRNENELVTKQAALYQIHTSDCTDNMMVTEEALAKIQERLNEEFSKHNESQDGIKQLENVYKKSDKDYQAMEQESQAILKETAKLDKEAVKFEEKKKFLAGKMKKLEKTIESSKFGISESAGLVQRAMDDIARSQGQVKQLEEEKEMEEQELEKIRQGLKGKTQGLSEQIATKQKLLEPFVTKASEKKGAMAVAQSEIDILRERENAGASAVDEVQKKIQSLVEAQSSKQNEMNDIKERGSSAMRELESLQKQLDNINVMEPNIRNKLSGARQKADEAKASLAASQTQGNVLSGLMRLKESGRISGFHGRLGNLGMIDSRFDVAVSTACPALDNLVVDSVEVGQQCIDHLRKNNLGRANFILLDRLPKRDLEAIQTPENVPRLFDLIKSKDDRFRPAFYSVLQNTLVAKDLEQANRIAYGAQRWRVVTLEGALIDKSGTMSGGGTRVMKGAMSSKLVAESSKEQVSKLEVDRDALEKEFASFQQQQKQLQESIRQWHNDIPKLETQVQKTEMELNSLDKNITDLKRRIQELSTQQKPSANDKARSKELERSIEKLGKEIEKISSESAGIGEEIKALQDKIMEVGGVKLRSQKAKVDGLQEQIDNRNEEISVAEVAKVKATNANAKHEKLFDESTSEIEKVRDETEQVLEDIRKHLQNATGIREQAEEAREALHDKKEELMELKKRLEEQTAELNASRAVEIELKNKLEENNKIMKDNQQRLRHWQEKLSKLSLQNINDAGEEGESLAVPEYSKDELDDFNKDKLKAEIAALEELTTHAVETSVLADYRKRVSEHATRTADLNSALELRDTAKRRLDDLRRLRLEGFMEGFSAISLRLKEMYQMITMGGNAELELVDSLDPFSEGILFSVMPPKKSWKNISNLSGGEKTLSSLALVFALHHYKPTPLYVMDEIDAALDFRNVSIVASYIKERTKNAQFIVISLRNNMFELASRLVGVYKVNHMVCLLSFSFDSINTNDMCLQTKSVTVENRDYLITRS